MFRRLIECEFFSLKWKSKAPIFNLFFILFRFFFLVMCNGIHCSDLTFWINVAKWFTYCEDFSTSGFKRSKREKERAKRLNDEKKVRNKTIRHRIDVLFPVVRVRTVTLYYLMWYIYVINCKENKTKWKYRKITNWQASQSNGRNSNIVRRVMSVHTVYTLH